MCSGFGVRVRPHLGLKLWAALEPSLTAARECLASRLSS